MSDPQENLGQHMLRDADAVSRVMAAARLQKGEVVLDAGAGTGVLTRPIARAVGAEGRVLAVELDARMIKTLKADLPKNAEIIQADLLEVPLASELTAVVANPPFKILAPFIERIVAAGIPRAVLVVPTELAERLTATPGSPRYGSLTVRVGILAEVAFVAHLNRRVFHPSPTVSCGIIVIRAREGAVMPDRDVLRSVLDAAGNAWGRKARHAFAALADANRLDSAKFQGMLREGEWVDAVVSTLPPSAFAAIAQYVAENRRA